MVLVISSCCSVIVSSCHFPAFSSSSSLEVQKCHWISWAGNRAWFLSQRARLNFCQEAYICTTSLCFSQTSASSLASFFVCVVAVSIMSCAALIPALSFLLIESFSFTFPSLRSYPTTETLSLMLLSCSLKEVSFARCFFWFSLPSSPAFFYQLQLSPLLLPFSLFLLLFYPPQVFFGRQNMVI